MDTEQSGEGRAGEGRAGGFPPSQGRAAITDAGASGSQIEGKPSGVASTWNERTGSNPPDELRGTRNTWGLEPGMGASSRFWKRAPERDVQRQADTAMGSERNNYTLKVFAGRSSRELALRVMDYIGQPLGQARTTVFPDGEILVKLEDDVRGRDCFVILSTCEPVNENLFELLVFIDCLRRASAARVTVVLPYFGYARQDRKDEGRVPITAKLVANLITAAGADRVLAVDLHAAQIQGFFDLPVDHLSATPVFVKYFNSIRNELGELCLVSPDVGNLKVAEGMQELLGAEHLAFINKKRLSGSLVKTGLIVGEVRDKTVLMFDDMISTAGTVYEAAKVVMDHGAKRVIAAATHGVLVGPAIERLSSEVFSQVVLTNTVAIGPRIKPIEHKLKMLCVGELLGEAITRIHTNESLSKLFEDTAGTKR
ncbi:MAG: ribose-phosphate pyrophosphokinase [Planctomycetota bacterium]|nr:ribose-phosphate pyrophosphokinase [Planctomycetota bacterium]